MAIKKTYAFGRKLPCRWFSYASVSSSFRTSAKKYYTNNSAKIFYDILAETQRILNSTAKMTATKGISQNATFITKPWTHSSSDTLDMVIMLGEAKLLNEMLTYQNITLTIRRNRNYPLPPAWTKGERRAQNEQNWLNKGSYRRWGHSARFLDFCHRWLSGLLFARKQLYRFGIKDSPACQMCGEDPQTVEHLFWYCPEINSIKEVIAANLNVSVHSFNPSMAEFRPHLTARVFHCIYLENIQTIAINPDKVLSRFHQYLDLEKVIMEKNGKMILFLKFWGNVHRP
jgi:hypothetical protein